MPEPDLDLSVIVVALREDTLLHRVVASASRSVVGISAEIVVVWIGDGGTPAFGHSPRVRVVRCPNRGFGAANNFGASNSLGRILWFLNPDARVLVADAPRLVEAFDACPTLGQLVTEIVLPNGQAQPHTYGRSPRIGDSILRRLPAAPIEWGSGASSLVSATAFRAVGGFDEEYFLYFEDTDLGRRLIDGGWNIARTQLATVLHVGGSSIGRGPQQRRWYYDSQRLFFRKHYGRHLEFLLVILRSPYRLIRILAQRSAELAD